MQGQRGGVGSLPETLNFDHGSSSSNAAVDQQICWNSMRDPSENRIPDYLLLQQSDLNITYVNAVSREQQSLARWSIGEPSSSGAANDMSHDERKAELGWTSAAPCVGDRPRLEERWFGPSNNFPPDNLTVNPMFIQGSNSDAVPPTLNLNSGYISHQDDSNHVTECPIIFKASGLENRGIPPTHSSDHFVSPPESGGLSLEGSDCRPSSSLEGRRLSCKRKAFEGSSVVGSSSYSQPTENAVIPARFNAGSNLVLSAPPDQANQRLRLGVREVISNDLSDINVAETTENAHRNFRIRISSSNQSGSIYPNVPSSGSIRHSGITSSQAPNRLLPVNYSMNLRSAPTTDNATSQNPPFVLRVPALPRSVPSSRVSAGLNSRSNGSSGLVGNLHATQSEDASSSMARTISENPLFAPATDSRSTTRNPSSRRAVNGNLSIPVSVPPISRTGSTMTTHAPSGLWLPHENPSAPQYPRRLSEIVRRQLFSSSAGMESGGGQQSNFSSLHSGSSSAHGLLLSSRAGNQGPHALLPRAMTWIERQADGEIGIPYSLRALSAPSEGSGSNRLVSEIRNVLGLMRRGENLRLEDVMILDQSVLFGMADFHDRHREMRLDVDNMSYEELLALEERIGNVSTGLSEETILTRLKRRKCCPDLGSPLEAEPCCICQEEYVEGEDVGKLACGHDYHTACIKQWLMLKNLCPICKMTALPT